MNLIDLVLPKLCGSCAAIISSKEHLCLGCELYLIHQVSVNKTYIKDYLKGRVPIHGGFSFLDYSKEDLTQDLLYNIKYQNQPQLAVYVSRCMAKKLDSAFMEYIDVIVPVPLHPNKQKLRGYNQSELIAIGIQQIHNIPINTATLRRKENTDSQTRKSKLSRWRNVKNAFELHNNSSLKNKHVLLIDDVFTTGATLEACASVLQKETVTECSILTLARA